MIMITITITITVKITITIIIIIDRFTVIIFIASIISKTKKNSQKEMRSKKNVYIVLFMFSISVIYV